MTNGHANSIIPSMTEEKKKHEELVALINSRIEHLRPKLLDLTRRNPLLSTRFSEKSNSHIRVIDELPNVLFTRINEGNGNCCRSYHRGCAT